MIICYNLRSSVIVDDSFLLFLRSSSLFVVLPFYFDRLRFIVSAILFAIFRFVIDYYDCPRLFIIVGHYLALFRIICYYLGSFIIVGNDPLLARDVRLQKTHTAGLNRRHRIWRNSIWLLNNICFVNNVIYNNYAIGTCFSFIRKYTNKHHVNKCSKSKQLPTNLKQMSNGAQTNAILARSMSARQERW